MMDNLIAELEAAPEGSEVLDVAICKAICHYGPDDPLWHVLPYSSSIDSALTLVPMGWGWSVGDIHGTCESAGIGRPWAEIWKRGDRPVRLPGMHRTTDGRCLINAATPALALCIAALKARQAMESS